jgi:DNA invertase Pin-like site-specific DNA recombinase
MKAVGYMRTSSATNVGEDKDSERRQRAAIEAYARSAGYTIDEMDFFYDPAVRGDDRLESRPGFAAMLERLAGSDVKVVIVEDASRFARDLIIQLTGHDHLKKLGITLIAANAPNHFIEDTPTAILIRQVLGAIAQFEKACLVAKLRSARDRKKSKDGKCEGRKSHEEINPEMVARAKALKAGRSLREVAALLAEDGYLSSAGKPFTAMVISRMVA